MYRCQHCRLRKCLAMGMRGDSVQLERRPGRPSLSVTRRRQQADLSHYNQEKFIMFSSLDQFKQTLHKTSSSPTTSLHSLELPLDSEMFDILPPSITTFSLTPPSSLNTSETASRVLFLSIHWTKKIPVFTSLPTAAQVSHCTSHSSHSPDILLVKVVSYNLRLKPFSSTYFVSSLETLCSGK